MKEPTNFCHLCGVPLRDCEEIHVVEGNLYCSEECAKEHMYAVAKKEKINAWLTELQESLVTLRRETDYLYTMHVEIVTPQEILKEELEDE